jgi:hypothetical protein
MLVLSILQNWRRNVILKDAISFPYISIYLKLQLSADLVNPAQILCLALITEALRTYVEAR